MPFAAISINSNKQQLYFSSRFVCLLFVSIYELPREMLYQLRSVPLTEGTGCSSAASQEA